MTAGAFVKRSIVDPAGIARQLKDERLSRGTLWSLLALVTVLSTLLVEAGLVLLSSDTNAAGFTPFTLTLILGSSLVVMVFAIQLTGQALGGTGRLDQALLLVAWWQGIGLVFQTLQLAAALVLPPLAGIVTLLGLGWLVFALMHFVNELHGFGSLFKALGCVAIGILGFSFGIAIILTLLGVSVQGGPS